MSSAEAAPTRGNQTILVCEDNDMVREVVAALLGSHGYHIIEASSGEEAMVRAAEWKGPLPLLVTDVMLPGIDGLELFAAMAAERPTLRVIAMSGSPIEVADLPAELAALGCVLQKPFNLQSMLTMVHAALERPREA